MNDYKVVESDTIKAKYCQLPIVDFYVRFMVEVLQPVAIVPTIKSIYYSDLEGADCKNTTISLKKLLLEEWKEQINVTDQTPPQWMKDVNKVELIECDLLVPKVEENVQRLF